MTKELAQEWYSSNDPRALMRAFVGYSISERKARLLMVAYCRYLGSSLRIDNKQYWNALEAAEQYADGHISNTARSDALEVAREEGRQQIHNLLGSIAEQQLRHQLEVDHNRQSAQGAKAVVLMINTLYPHVTLGEFIEVCFYTNRVVPNSRYAHLYLPDLLRDALPNPYLPAPVIEPAWLTWNDGTVKKIAQVIYDEQRFEALPILADALEEAGCTDNQILDNCRSGSPHVRGNWVVDLILGKELWTSRQPEGWGERIEDSRSGPGRGQA